MITAFNNDLYDDGHGYIYMMKEGRWRPDSGGGVRFKYFF